MTCNLNLAVIWPELTSPDYFPVTGNRLGEDSSDFSQVFDKCKEMISNVKKNYLYFLKTNFHLFNV